MASIDFIAHETVVPAAWLNEIDRTQHDILGNPSNAADVRTAISVDSSAEVTAKDDAILADLASTDSGKGSSLIAIPATASEISSGVTIVNSWRQPGDLRRYGAVCDGVTDDTTAYTRARSQCLAGGDPILVFGVASLATLGFDAVIDGPLEIIGASPGAKLVGPGKSTSSVHLLDDGSLTIRDIDIEDFGYFLNFTDNPVGTGHVRYENVNFTDCGAPIYSSKDTSGTGIADFYARNVSVDNDAPTGYGFYLRNHGVVRAEIDGCLVRNVLRRGIIFGAINDGVYGDFRLINSRVDGVYPSGDSAYAVLVYGSTDSSSFIHNNRIENVVMDTTPGEVRGIYNRGVARAVVTDNILINAGISQGAILFSGHDVGETPQPRICTGNIIIFDDDYYPTQPRAGVGIKGDNVIVAHNYIQGAHHPVLLFSSACNNIVIEGNTTTILAESSDTAAMVTGVMPSASSNITIRGNRLLSAVQNGAGEVRGVADFAQMSSNLVIDANEIYAEVNYGIRLSSSGAENIAITDNTITDSVVGIQFNNACNRVRVRGNTVVSSSSPYLGLDLLTNLNADPSSVPVVTVSTLPSASVFAAALVAVSNESGGYVIAFSDGTNWRRVTDRNIVS